MTLLASRVRVRAARSWLARRRRSRGQALVELAITLPVLLLLVAGTIDLGRVYLMTINMQNAAKEGAFFGARTPECDTDATAGCTDPQTVLARVELELDGITPATFDVKCFAPGTAPATFKTSAGKALTDCDDGDLYYVEVGAPFNLITPIASTIVGTTLNLESSATAVVLTSFAPSGNPIDPNPGASPTPTPAPNQCTVPNFTNGTKLNQAQDVWENVANFETDVTEIGPGGQDIAWQSLPAGFVGACDTTTITVSNTVQATPTPTPTPTPLPSPTPSPSPTGPVATPPPSPTPAPSPTPLPSCTVPQMVFNGNNAVTVTQAQGIWSAAGFRPENFSAVRPPNNDYDVEEQSIPAGSSRPCLTTTITVDN
jgi:hypothetical protein